MQLPAALFLLALPSIALANAGLPMLAVVWPLSLPAFIPIVVLESWILRRTLNISWRIALTQMVKANVLSTLIGIPLAWAISFAFELLLMFVVVNIAGSNSYPPHWVGDVGRVILSAPWLGPYREGGYWILPVAMSVLLIPFFFVSFWTEAWYVAGNVYPSDPKQARRAIWKANLCSYLVLFLACIGWLVFGLATHT